MEKAIAAFEARRKFGKILNDVVAKGDRFIVERHGEPVAAVVPIGVYEQWKRARESFFDRMEAIGRRVDMPEDEAEQLVQEAIGAVRATPARGQ
jgi:prevent-host-death family protein